MVTLFVRYDVMERLSEDELLQKALMDFIHADDHRWGSRLECLTCHSMSILLGRAFGCEYFQEQSPGVIIGDFRRIDDEV